MNYTGFVKEIYSYCDLNQCREVLFPVFMNLMQENDNNITRNDLAVLTSKIVHKLIEKNVLRDVPNEFENVYGTYRILEHKNLVRHGGFIDKKMKLLS